MSFCLIFLLATFVGNELNIYINFLKITKIIKKLGHNELKKVKYAWAGHQGCFKNNHWTIKINKIGSR